MNAQELKRGAQDSPKAVTHPVQSIQRRGSALAATPVSIAQLKLQEKADCCPQVSQLKAIQAKMSAGKTPLQRKKNDTGLPDNLKSGVESLSGHSMDDVKVHYNSSQPAQLNALAYAQGTDIHVAPGQEQHLPHEAWHVAQQKQGRVQPTTQLKESVPVNDDPGLESEADVMGAKAMQMQMPTSEEPVQGKFETAQLEEEPMQGKFETAQLQAMEEEPMQGKFETAQLQAMEEEPMQGKFETAQLEAMEEEPMQGKFETAQLEAMEEEPA